jgi:hypothetical protein
MLAIYLVLLTSWVLDSLRGDSPAYEGVATGVMLFLASAGTLVVRRRAEAAGWSLGWRDILLKKWPIFIFLFVRVPLRDEFCATPVWDASKGEYDNFVRCMNWSVEARHAAREANASRVEKEKARAGE